MSIERASPTPSRCRSAPRFVGAIELWDVFSPLGFSDARPIDAGAPSRSHPGRGPRIAATRFELERGRPRRHRASKVSALAAAALSTNAALR